MTPAQVAWFTVHCDRRFRYFHATRPDWQEWLEDRDWKIDPRDQCKVWIRHWLAAYVLDPAGYQERCASCPACGNPLGDISVRRECNVCGFKSKPDKPPAAPQPAPNVTQK